MSLSAHASVLVLTTFRAPGCPLAAEERVQRRPGEDACKFSYDVSKNSETLTEDQIKVFTLSRTAKHNQMKLAWMRLKWHI